MVQNIFHIILAAFGLGFLVFIHELGHYFIARREKMTVEAFAIGFGKPFFTWTHKGVKWHLCILPFGGYVKIAGMEKKGPLEPYQIPDGFYGKKPISRIRVALAGPFVNIIFSFFAFSLIWIAGGREKPFSEYTHLIGWVDPLSALYKEGVMQGDVIDTINGRPYGGVQDLLYAAILGDHDVLLSGEKIDYWKPSKEPFQSTLKIGRDLEGYDPMTKTIGVLAPASYLLYDRFAKESPNSLPEGSPMLQSGIQYGDRLFWMDGELLFSRKQLVSLLNDGKTLLTVQRGDDVFLTRVPRLHISDLQMSAVERVELDDARHAASLGSKVQSLFFLPYALSVKGVVERSVSFLDECSDERLPEEKLVVHEIALLPGDKIIAVDGAPVSSLQEILKNIQVKKVQIIVQRDKDRQLLSLEEADRTFEQVDLTSLKEIVASIGRTNKQEVGSFYLLQPVVPKTYLDLSLSPEKKAEYEERMSRERKKLEAIEDPKTRTEALAEFEEYANKLMLGVNLQDRAILFNPPPIKLFGDVYDQTVRTLSALFTGYVHPKMMSGPVGIVGAIHRSWELGWKEALFWMGVISFNLGILNLLPIPVLDGGHVCFSLWEMITGKKIKAKTMEKFIFPFIGLLIFLFIYLTYNDIVRLFTGFFK